MDIDRDHGAFLDYSKKVGLNVMPGYYLEPSKIRGQCPEFDCFQRWKKATLDGFEHGYRTGDSWHPSVALVVLLNEADGFGSLPECQPSGAWCRVKAALSALDGVLAAEKEVGVDAGRVKFTVTWSFATRESIDGKMRGPGIYGFQDMVAGIQDPQIAKYSPRAELADLQEAFKTRWVHGLNTKSPWSFALGTRVMGQTGQTCDRSTPWLEGTKAHRAQALATAWGGFIDDSSLCSGGRRLDVTVGTHVACQIRAGAVSGGASAVSAALVASDLKTRIVSRTESLLGGSDALRGDLSLARTGAWAQAQTPHDVQSGTRTPQAWAVCVASSIVAWLFAA